MKHGWLVLALASGCYGGVQYDWEAQVVVGVESQRVPASAIGADAATAMWLSVRGGAGDIAYPLRLEGTELVLDSAFDGAALPVQFEPYVTPLAMRPASIAVPLRPPIGKRSPAEALPGEIDFSATLEITVLGGDEPVRTPLEIRPVFDPCLFLYTSFDDRVPPIAPNATSKGQVLDQDATQVHVGPFVLRVVVQTSCSESVG
jgi:hypothetical protein